MNRVTIGKPASASGYEGWAQPILWCAAQYGFDSYDGASGPGWCYHGQGVFEFADEKDMMIFSLKWS